MCGHALRGSSSSERAARIGEVGVLGAGGVSTDGIGRGEPQTESGVNVCRNKEPVRRCVFVKRDGAAATGGTVLVDTNESFGKNDSCIGEMSCAVSGVARTRGEDTSREGRGPPVTICWRTGRKDDA